MCGCSQRPEDGFGSPRIGVRGRYESPDVTELRVSASGSDPSQSSGPVSSTIGMHFQPLGSNLGPW